MSYCSAKVQQLQIAALWKVNPSAVYANMISRSRLVTLDCIALWPQPVQSLTKCFNTSLSLQGLAFANAWGSWT